MTLFLSLSEEIILNFKESTPSIFVEWLVIVSSYMGVWSLLYKLSYIITVFKRSSACVVQNVTLNDWSRGEQRILLPENRTKFTVPQGASHYVICYKQNKSWSWKTRWDSSDIIHLHLHSLITCNSGQHFVGNSELFPVWRHSFRNVTPSLHLAVDNFIVGCHATMN